MDTITLDTLIDKTEQTIAILERRETINVAMRVSETITILKDVRSDLHTIKGDQKFDLVATTGANLTVVYTNNGEIISAGSNVLTYGDQLNIAVTASSTYKIKKFIVNGINYADGSSELDFDFDVTTNFTVEFEAEKITYTITPTLVHTTADDTNPATIEAGGTASLMFTAEVGYELPAEVTVTGATGSWESSTGVLDLSVPTGNVTFTITSTEEQEVE